MPSLHVEVYLTYAQSFHRFDPTTFMHSIQLLTSTPRLKHPRHSFLRPVLALSAHPSSRNSQVDVCSHTVSGATLGISLKLPDFSRLPSHSKSLTQIDLDQNWIVIKYHRLVQKDSAGLTHAPVTSNHNGLHTVHPPTAACGEQSTNRHRCY